MVYLIKVMALCYSPNARDVNGAIAKGEDKYKRALYDDMNKALFCPIDELPECKFLNKGDVKEFLCLLLQKHKFHVKLFEKTKEAGQLAKDIFYEKYQNMQQYAYAVRFAQASIDESRMVDKHMETVEIVDAFWKVWDGLSRTQQRLTMLGLIRHVH